MSFRFVFDLAQLLHLEVLSVAALGLLVRLDIILDGSTKRAT